MLEKPWKLALISRTGHHMTTSGFLSVKTEVLKTGVSLLSVSAGLSVASFTTKLSFPDQRERVSLITGDKPTNGDITSCGVKTISRSRFILQR